MKETERLRQVVSGQVGVEELKPQIERGWKLVALEWEREVEVESDDEAENAAEGAAAHDDRVAVETAEVHAIPVRAAHEVEPAVGPLPADVPFGLQVGAETRRLEENPMEREILFQLMELIVEEGSYARIADEINRRGFRTRQGAEWSPVSVFEMLPRLIEVGPQVFKSAEWQKRKQHFAESVAR
ncbi:MAG: recombinase family protein [Terriglobales bacterium]|jgi:hypothetical protein